MELLFPAKPGYSVKITCTDRGRHSRSVLQHVKDTRGEPTANERVMYPDGPARRAPVTSWSPETGEQGFTFHCPRCGRNLPLRQETLFELLDGLAEQEATGHPVIDISVLEYVLSTRRRP